VTALPPFAETAALHARTRPGAVAILDGETRWTWAELDRRAGAFAAGIAAAGVRPGDRVGVLAVSSAGVVAALHGLVRAGCVAVPIAPRLARPEVAAIAAATRLRAFVAPSDAAAYIAGVSTLDLDALLAAATNADAAVTADAAASDTAAVIVPTSGTTGRPKLVVLGLSQLDASAESWFSILPPATGWLLSLNLAHVSGIGIVVRAARAGVPVVVAQTGAEPILPSLRAAAARGIAVSHFSLVAAQLARLLESGGAPPAGVRAVILGGGPISEELVARAAAAGWPVLTSYGMTETASGVAAVPPEGVASRPWSAGRPMAGVEIRVEDAADDGTGEILVRGRMVFDCYDGDAASTAVVLDRAGWLHTGDLGSIDTDGWLRVAGRRDEMIISGGEKIAPAQVEGVLAAHPAVADVAVLGVADEKWGAVPVALVVFKPGMRATTADLGSFARERLASFKAPARFVEVAEIPRTANGKLLRASLPALLAATGRRHSRLGTVVITVDDGQRLATRDLAGPPGAPDLVLLHATLSSSGQLLRLALGLRDAARTLLIDRRGSGESVMTAPAPVSIARHTADIAAALDAAGIERPVIFGHSFGALLALEFAARYPRRVAAAIAYEPPYGAVADPVMRSMIGRVGHAVADAYAAGGPARAAEVFVRAVAGDSGWDRLTPPQRAFLEAEGSGALADASMLGLEPLGLARITCPVVLVTGGESDAFYAPIADELAVRIPGSTRLTLPGLRHTAPITDPAPFAALIRETLSGI